MKHKNKIQIAGLGLALALSQAVSAYAAGTVVVGKAPGETAAETTAAEASTKAAPAVLSTPAHVVTAGSHEASNSPTPALQPSTAGSRQQTAIYCGSRQHAVNGFRGSHQSAGGCGRGRCTVKRGNR